MLLVRVMRLRKLQKIRIYTEMFDLSRSGVGKPEVDERHRS